MLRSVRDKWCAALRSGEYRQVAGVLKRVDGDGPRYCCLGVLAEVMGDGPSQGLAGSAFLSNSAKYGIPPNAPPKMPPLGVASTSCTQQALAGRNDAGWPFARIADHIEQHMPVEEDPS